LVPKSVIWTYRDLTFDNHTNLCYKRPLYKIKIRLPVLYSNYDYDIKLIKIMIKTAIILAPDDNGLQPIFGTPAVRRLSILLLQQGIKSIHLVGRVTPFRHLLSDLIPSNAFHQMDDPALLGGLQKTLRLAKDEHVLVLKANHVTDILSLTRLTKACKGTGVYFMKAGNEYGGGGLYVVGTADLVNALHILWLPNEFNTKFSERPEIIKGIGGLPYAVEQGNDLAKIAEERLLAVTSLQTEMDDGFLARHVDRRISRFISKRLSHTKISPNQITMCGMTIGLVGAFFLSCPGYWLQFMGSLLFLFCVIIDGVDGEIARLKLKETRFGHYLDVITDNIVHVAVFVGIAFGLYNETGNIIYLYSLWFLMGGFCVCVIAVYFCILRRSPEEIKQAPKALRLMALLTNRDFAYLIVALAVIHRLNWFLIGSAAGTYVFAFILWTVSSRETRVALS